MGTSQRDLDLQVLEHIYEQDDGEGQAFIGSIRGLVGEDTAATTCRGLRERGLIREGHRAGEYHVTAAGRAEVDAMSERRRDRGLRRRLCHNEFLRWIDSRNATEAAARVAREDYDVAVDLEPFTDQETEAAAEHLKRHGLIESISAAEADHILVWITDLGQECIDEGGEVAAFVSKDTTALGSQIFNISGSGNSVAAAIGANNEVTASLSSFAPKLAAEFAEAVRQAIPALNLDAERVQALVADIQQRDDPNRAQRATAQLQTMLVSTTTGTLGQVLGLLGASALGIGT